MMKKFIYALGVLALVGLSSCNDDDALPNVVPQDRGTVTDNLGNVYEWVRIGDQLWTTTNALNGTPMTEVEYYNNYKYVYVVGESELEYVEEEYIPEFGNLMSYDDAVGSAPEGWRLPSDEDWQRLERTLGMSGTDRKGWRGDGVAYKLQETTSGCQLGLLLGGSCIFQANLGYDEQKLQFVNEYGYFWTSTIEPAYDSEHTQVYYRKIAANVGKVGRECMRSEALLAVRWVKDAE